MGATPKNPPNGKQLYGREREPRANATPFPSNSQIGGADIFGARVWEHPSGAYLETEDEGQSTAMLPGESPRQKRARFRVASGQESDSSLTSADGPVASCHVW